MMTTVNTVAAKFAVAFVAVAMMFTLVAPAQAQNAEDMSLEELLALVAQLQSELGGESMTSPSAICPYTWTRNLNMGATGDDVMKLQQFLNSMPETMVAASGAGSAGNETSYYGPATGAAVSKFQMKYRSEILTPLGLVNPTTFFGNSTRAQANDVCAVAPTDGGDDMDGNDDDDDMDDDDFELSGEASLESFEVDDASDDDIEEDEEDAEVAEIMVEFTDGDAEISRLDIQLIGNGETDTSTVEPWEAFESISLWVDGDKVAEMDADDEDEYLDEDTGELRLSGLDIVAMEDDELEIIVAVTTQDGLDADELTDWDVNVTAMRFFDADGVATTEEGAPVTDDTATFTLDEAGAEDELQVSSSDVDPEATTLLLDDEDEETHVVFGFDLDTDDSTNDIEINELVIDATVSSATAAVFIDGDNVALLMDGDEIPTDDITVAGNTLTFEFDGGDFVIDAGDEVSVELEVTFDALADGDQGVTMSFDLDGTDAKIDAEGADDLIGTQISGAASGETHTLITEGIVILAEDVSFSTDTSGDNDTLGEFEIEFDVTAYEDDFYITDTVTANTATEGAVFRLQGPATTTATTTGTLTSTAEEDTDGVFTVEEGDTETFTLRVTADVTTSGDYRVRMMSVYYSTNTDGTTGAVARVLTPASDYRTGYETIQNN